MGAKNKDEIYHILDKYAVYWEDATSLGEWNDMEDAKKDSSALAFAYFLPNSLNLCICCSVISSLIDLTPSYFLI